MNRKKKIIDSLNLTISNCGAILNHLPFDLPFDLATYNIIGLTDYDPIHTSDFFKKYISLIDDSIINVVYIDLTHNVIKNELSLELSEFLLPKSFNSFRDEHIKLYSDPIEWGFFIYGKSWVILYCVKYDEAIIYHKNMNVKKELVDYIY